MDFFIHICVSSYKAIVITKICCLFNKIDKFVFGFPAPIRIKFFWGVGSILGVALVVQIVSGLMLAMRYISESQISFQLLDIIVREISKGDILRLIHAKGASVFFIFMFLHIGRGLYFKSSVWKVKVWFLGVIIFSLSMAAAFLGYILPWGKMSFWAATVITNLFRAVPIVGRRLVKWILGGFTAGRSTLRRFFYLHTLIPLLIFLIVGLHVVGLHETGSSDPLKLNKSQNSYIRFHPFYTIKDIVGFMVMFILLIFLVNCFPYVFMDRDKFKLANPLKTPAHIQPEWYFLAAYTILRSVPNKLGGVLGLLGFILVLFVRLKFKVKFYFNHSTIFWIWTGVCLGLVWIGMCGVDGYFLFLGRIFSVLYFLLTLILLKNFDSLR